MTLRQRKKRQQDIAGLFLIALSVLSLAAWFLYALQVDMSNVYELCSVYEDEEEYCQLYDGERAFYSVRLREKR